ncbi:protein kinase [Gordonia pseudamarae]|jgi:hypothetical protein|uniref:non-specific serine/threonine protein kinase n=1 Tax=Gordonia pseudamarae TaxID=2831662 RepID=A0ABX6IFF1_9ACTN|nr:MULTISPECIES: serine/threonine-protein kinase [Gordonia]MBD0020517.1 protein kinase [Gordonia sp. (in: high G+C Gram-positive bacteria)]QHN25644.1 protein kinase [Gordonia pseudamarae]QHN34576.1 protein kinase [Gordonia pseudamarae]
MNAHNRVGSSFGPYRLDDLIGRGGMGEVYRAYDTTKDRFVALKILSQGPAADPTYQARFRRESQVVARLGEPHIIPIHDWGEIDGVLYLDMRLVEGKDLRAVLREEGALSPARAVAIVEQVGAALDAAHRDGLVHRDVKPENILLSENDFAHLVDFGIAQAGDDTRLTQAGTAIGSLAYMAPEMFETAPITSACDIYALTCVLFETLTGQVPHPASTVSSAIKAALFDTPPRVGAVNSAVPASFDAVIARGMNSDPLQRYSSGRELARACRAALEATEQAPALEVPDPPTAYPAGQYEQTQIRVTGPSASGPAGPAPTGGNPPGTNPYGAQVPPGPVGTPIGAGFAPEVRQGTTPYGASGQYGGAYGTGPQATGPYGQGPHPTGAQGYPTGAQGYPPGDGGRGRSLLVPIVGIIAVALVGLLAVVAVVLLTKDSDGDSDTRAEQSTAVVTTTVTPAQDTPATTTPTVTGPPANSSRCDGSVGIEAGTPTSCEFAANVRSAYLASGPKGEARVVTASSPITGSTYRMSCGPENGIVVCRGGNNAVVHIY